MVSCVICGDCLIVSGGVFSTIQPLSICIGVVSVIVLIISLHIGLPSVIADCINNTGSSDSLSDHSSSLHTQQNEDMFWGWGSSANDDTKRYRDGYPGQENDLSEKNNLLFYENKIASRPRGDLIDTIHSEWIHQYGMLEAHHGYIQWLFPIREEGMNSQSQRLHKHELDAIVANPTARARVLKSYRLMLDFYGLVLLDSTTGQLAHNENFKERFYNLNTSGHNYLRITRILKCLGELGYEHLKFRTCFWLPGTHACCLSVCWFCCCRSLLSVSLFSVPVCLLRSPLPVTD